MDWRGSAWYIRNQEQIHLNRLGFMPVPEWERWIDLD